MIKNPPRPPFWFIREGDKLKPCSKAEFDQAILEGKSIRYRGYANKREEHIAEKLEASRMEFLAKPDLPEKFKTAITNPANVIEVQIMQVDDPEFWLKEFKHPKYHQ
ncbi:MAG: hypothetical protein NWF01_08030 [Candidatus Bathyarchaeota archaeon]|nr:hypothetical protein [Candidatus Bathyarchaeota archaeon]